MAKVWGLGLLDSSSFFFPNMLGKPLHRLAKNCLLMMCGYGLQGRQKVFERWWFLLSSSLFLLGTDHGFPPCLWFSRDILWGYFQFTPLGGASTLSVTHRRAGSSWVYAQGFWGVGWRGGQLRGDGRNAILSFLKTLEVNLYIPSMTAWKKETISQLLRLSPPPNSFHLPLGTNGSRK